MDMQPRKEIVNGAELAYLDSGSGDPVILVHGSTSDYRSWGGQIAPLSELYRVIAVSRRRHWPNSWPEPDSGLCSANEHAADLAGLIEMLGLGPCHLVGSSYGALTALTMTVGRPELTRSLVLGEPPLLPWLRDTPDGQALYDAFQANAWLPAGQAFASGESEEGVRQFINGVIGEGAFDHLPTNIRAAMLDNAAVMGVELRTPADVYFPSLSHDDVSGVKVQTLLLTGGRARGDP